MTKLSYIVILLLVATSCNVNDSAFNSCKAILESQLAFDNRLQRVNAVSLKIKDEWESSATELETLNNPKVDRILRAHLLRIMELQQEGKAILAEASH